LAAYEAKQIIIDPMPDFSVALSSTSLDLTLSKIVRLWSEPVMGSERTICPASLNYSYNTIAENFTVLGEIGPTGYILKPHQFLLAWTAEEITLPTSSRLAARVEGKSSLARLGIGVHVTAPTIHAGFDGPIQLEIVNHGELDVKLEVGMRVCQLIFEQTAGTPDKGYKGQFLKQSR
jgi:dCTP deaminase